MKPPPGSSRNAYTDCFRCSSDHCNTSLEKGYDKCAECLLKHDREFHKYGVIFDRDQFLNDYEIQKLLAMHRDSNDHQKEFVGALGESVPLEIDESTDSKKRGATAKGTKATKSQKPPQRSTRSSGRTNKSLSTEDVFRDGDGRNQGNYHDHTFRKEKFVDLNSMYQAQNCMFANQKHNYAMGTKKATQQRKNGEGHVNIFLDLDKSGPSPFFLRYDDSEHTNMTTTCKLLGERGTDDEKKLSSCYPYNYILQKLMDNGRRVVLLNEPLSYAAFFQCPLAQCNLKYNRPRMDLDEQHKNQPFPPNLFSAAEMHPSTAKEHISFFEPHHDSRDAIVCFIPLDGFSWNFVSVEDDKKDKPYIDLDAADGPLYKKFRDGLSIQEKAQVEAFEHSLITKADAKRGGTRLLVFYLTKGRRLFFNAHKRLHGTIIPANTDRCILILHRLEVELTQYLASERDIYNTQQKLGKLSADYGEGENEPIVNP